MPEEKRKKRRGRIDYSVYRLTIVQTLESVAAAGLAAAAIAFIFYKNIFISAAALLLGLLGPRLYSRQLAEKRRAELNLQFKDMLYALNAAMTAGKTLEDSLRTARRDMRILYPDGKAVILEELDYMVSQLDINTPITDLMTDLGVRSCNDEIQSFADVLSNGLDKGIDQVNLVQKTVSILTEKLEIKQEIATNVAAVRMEQSIMLLMPVALMLMIHLMAPDYMQTLYDAPVGYVIITVALGLIGLSVLWARKIMNIKV